MMMLMKNRMIIRRREKGKERKEEREKERKKKRKKYPSLTILS